MQTADTHSQEKWENISSSSWSCSSWLEFVLPFEYAVALRSTPNNNNNNNSNGHDRFYGHGISTFSPSPSFEIQYAFGIAFVTHNAHRANNNFHGGWWCVFLSSSMVTRIEFRLMASHLFMECEKLNRCVPFGFVRMEHESIVATETMTR